ncbi:Transposase, partial [Phytophthora megakarya]
RILNTDNYYTSVQLLEVLRIKGLYARGTVREGSKHFPKHTTLDKNSASRGDYRPGVSSEHGFVAASWWDGSLVQMVSNADASSLTNLEGTIGGTKPTYPAPTCVSQYNKYMQGVDRLDQYRGRFSFVDGHSYQKWRNGKCGSLMYFRSFTRGRIGSFCICGERTVLTSASPNFSSIRST